MAIKRILFFSAISAITLFTACQKTYNCQCTENGASGVYQGSQYNFPITDDEDVANTSCVSGNNVNDTIITTCVITGEL